MADNDDTPTVDPPVSKNAMKKAAKAQYYAEKKTERRLHEKEQKKQKKRQLAERQAAGELDEEDEVKIERMIKRRKLGREVKDFWPGKIVIDLGFDDKMSEKEVASLTSQLGYVYAANRRAIKPCSTILFTDFNHRPLQRFESIQDSSYKRWTNCEWWRESFQALWTDAPIASSSTFDSTTTLSSEVISQPTAATPTSIEPTTTEPATTISAPSRACKTSVVYLTADSSEELSELSPDEVYVIGGIVDHNRYKRLCLDKANEIGIRHARLPIGTYIASLPTRKVLTVNQVFEILLKWIETKDWEQAFNAVIPLRKFRGATQAGDAPTGTDNSTVEETPLPAIVLREEDLEEHDFHNETAVAQQM